MWQIASVPILTINLESATDLRVNLRDRKSNESPGPNRRGVKEHEQRGVPNRTWPCRPGNSGDRTSNNDCALARPSGRCLKRPQLCLPEWHSHRGAGHFRPRKLFPYALSVWRTRQAGQHRFRAAARILMSSMRDAKRTYPSSPSFHFSRCSRRHRSGTCIGPVAADISVRRTPIQANSIKRRAP
jgi:hypothetical protein